MKHKQEMASGKNIIEQVKELENKRDDYKLKYRNFRKGINKIKSKFEEKI